MMHVWMKLERETNRPLFRQIMDRIIDLVDSNVLKPGSRLPSTREMASFLSINRSTVYRAYQELWSLGYLESRPGAYSVIRYRPKTTFSPTHERSSLIQWDKRSTSISHSLFANYIKESELMDKIAGENVINFLPLSPDSRLFPMDEFRKCMNHVLIKKGVDLLQYGSPLGYSPLRDFIADRMRLHGVTISKDEIMITTGAQNAIELILKLLVGSKDSVALESPTYARAIDIFRLTQAKMLNIPMNNSGMNLVELERLIKKKRPALIYTIPNFHNPTGITTDQSHREQLIHIGETYEIPIVEDGFEEEMKYFGKAVLPIKSMDHKNIVVYLGTFSKILFPGLRIGWIAADQKLIQRLIPLQKASILSGNLLDQAALDRFCREGYYNLHINRMHRIYRKRMQKAFSAIQIFLCNPNIEWNRPAGGFIIWLKLKNLNLKEEIIIHHLLESGVMALPGSSHFHGPAGGIYFRISIAHLDEPAIEEGIKRLGRCIDRLYG